MPLYVSLFRARFLLPLAFLPLALYALKQDADDSGQDKKIKQESHAETSYTSFALPIARSLRLSAHDAGLFNVKKILPLAITSVLTCSRHPAQFRP